MSQPSDSISAYSYPSCSCCGTAGALLYEGLKDGLFGAPGSWNIKKCSNPACGSLWLDPMPTKEDIGRAYRNYYTHEDVAPSKKWYRKIDHAIKQGYLALRYGYHARETPLWKKCMGLIVFCYPARRAQLDFSVMYLSQRPKGRLLEVGCGGGRMLKYMEGLQWNVEGLDFDSVAVKNAKAKGLNVHNAALEDLRYQDNLFDAIIGSHVVEHVHDPGLFLRECYRILKPGGKLILVTPNIDSLGHYLYKRNWRGLEPPRHLHMFNISSLSRLAQGAQFKKIRTWTTIRDAASLLMASRLIERNQPERVGKRQPWSIRLSAKVIQMIEWLILKVFRNRGEEMVLVGEK